MPRDVHTNLDKPLTILGMDGEDFGTMVGLIAVSYQGLKFVIGSRPGLAVGFVLGTIGAYLVSRIKRGKGPGYIQQKVWSLGLPVPGLMKYRRPGSTLSS